MAPITLVTRNAITRSSVKSNHSIDISDEEAPEEVSFNAGKEIEMDFQAKTKQADNKNKAEKEEKSLRKEKARRNKKDQKNDNECDQLAETSSVSVFPEPSEAQLAEIQSQLKSMETETHERKRKESFKVIHKKWDPLAPLKVKAKASPIQQEKDTIRKRLKSSEMDKIEMFKDSRRVALVGKNVRLAAPIEDSVLNFKASQYAKVPRDKSSIYSVYKTMTGIPSYKF